ncbi:hypothetical protein [Risungbinella massiliensis]|uniref:hypothetical protein n=1 Tax=Risungbinella massiliensis TaxID=1329796 RepID=UPI0005CC7288|nr:hypothetical protein [Risungbinella massiliensis]
MAKKTRNRERATQRPKKGKYTNIANFFYQEQVAPLEKAYRQHMQSKQYELAEQAFAQSRIKRDEYRQILYRREKKQVP